MTKKVAIIGAGASGLVAIHCCIEEGLEPVCFERTDGIGGIWNYSTEINDKGSVTSTTVINTSKEMMTFSDFPIPANFPNYMHNSRVQQYFELYANHFSLKNYIRFRTEILKVKRAPDFSSTGSWILETKELENDKVSEETYDAILLCTGHHADKYVPNFPGDDIFKGKIIHTHDYRTHEGYEGKRVVVIGIGNSGGDVAVDLSRISKQVFLSTRRGAWVLNRVGEHGIPSDMLGNRRIVQLVRNHLPRSLYAYHLEKQLNQRFDHALYGMKPQHRIDEQHPTVSDELPNRISCGMVVVKPDIKRFTETGVEFVDGTVEEKIDVIFLATGYVFGFPFLEEDVIKVEKNKVDLFKYVFPPQLNPPTLAVIGCVQPWGAINPISEIQCRWVTRVFKGIQALPSVSEMKSDIKAKETAMAERYVASPRHTLQVDYVAIMDEYAEQLGCKPNIVKLFKEDFRLAMSVLLGPCTPYQFRLEGPGKKDNARDLIMTQWERFAAPMKTRSVLDNPSSKIPIKLLLFVLFLALLFKWLIF